MDARQSGPPKPVRPALASCKKLIEGRTFNLVEIPVQVSSRALSCVALDRAVCDIYRYIDIYIHIYI